MRSDFPGPLISAGFPDGTGPNALIQASDGNLYGRTSSGGDNVQGYIG